MAGTGSNESVSNRLVERFTASHSFSKIAPYRSAKRSAAQAVGGTVNPILGLGSSQAGLAGGLIGMGQQQAGIGNQINQMGGQLAGRSNVPWQTGMQLLQEPIDPQTQQQMMKAGLGSAANNLGAASLGQGMAGQSAAARQLGLNTLQYGQAMRGEQQMQATGGPQPLPVTGRRGDRCRA